MQQSILEHYTQFNQTFAPAINNKFLALNQCTCNMQKQYLMSTRTSIWSESLWSELNWTGAFWILSSDQNLPYFLLKLFYFSLILQNAILIIFIAVKKLKNEGMFINPSYCYVQEYKEGGDLNTALAMLLLNIYIILSLCCKRIQGNKSSSTGHFLNISIGTQHGSIC